MICVLRVGEHILPVIIASVCFPTQETHVTRDLCSGEHVSWETTYDSDITDMCYPKHISLVKCVSPTREHIHCITTDICFLGRGTHGIPGKHIPRDMYSLGRGTRITRDMCFPEKGTHITSDMCGMVREHISIRICVSQVIISVPRVGEHISLGISLLCHSDMCSPILSEMCFPYKRNSDMCSPTWEADITFPG